VLYVLSDSLFLSNSLSSLIDNTYQDARKEMLGREINVIFSPLT